MFHYRKIGGLHFASCGRYGVTWYARRAVRASQAPINRLHAKAVTGDFERRGGRVVRASYPSAAQIAGAFVGALALLLIAAAPASIEGARHKGATARWMLTHSAGRNVYIDDFNLTFDDCMGMRANGQRCRLQPKGVNQ